MPDKKRIDRIDLLELINKRIDELTARIKDLEKLFNGFVEVSFKNNQVLIEMIKVFQKQSANVATVGAIMMMTLDKQIPDQATLKAEQEEISKLARQKDVSFSEMLLELKNKETLPPTVKKLFDSLEKYVKMLTSLGQEKKD